MNKHLRPSDIDEIIDRYAFHDLSEKDACMKLSCSSSKLYELTRAYIRDRCSNRDIEIVNCRKRRKTTCKDCCHNKNCLLLDKQNYLLLKK